MSDAYSEFIGFQRGIAVAERVCEHLRNSGHLDAYEELTAIIDHAYEIEQAKLSKRNKETP